ncbi:argininosuccinate lyase [Candidatus Micrarchaeota archaeon]|nr:argininosuccinate lyase [Candidatus Micrarchaeota archaeon]
MAKLWKKGYGLDADAEDYTVGEDYLLDQELLPYDVQASVAHAEMLSECGYLSKEEAGSIVSALKKLGTLEIKKGDEDSHTAIENYLVEKLGETGKKIHTARSRNDQCLVAMRLYFKDHLQKLESETNSLIEGLKKKKDVPMPGYTHTRKAMPSSSGMLFSAYADSLEDDLALLQSVKKILDKNPLGSAAGYGVPLKISKESTTSKLGFGKTQGNPIHCANSRGKYELLVANVLTSIMLDLNKIASDLILFSTPEFGFFKLSKELCTGSSIMPQKVNPDPLELVRANYHVVSGYEAMIKGICSNLISGYHRDFQLTKGPALKSMKITLSSLKVMQKIISGLEPDEEKMKEAMSKELYATEEAYKLVEQGVPFRDAYKEVGKRFM